MSIKPSKNPFLFSAGTLLAYKIAKTYYNDVHYVWCTTEFHSLSQAVTSNPLSICKRLLEITTTGDRHAKEINDNKAGILIGANEKLKTGIITSDQYKTINEYVSCASYDAFLPVLYIIDSRKVKTKCIEVLPKEKASDISVEYKITELHNDDFQIIQFRDLLNGIINTDDRKAGE